MSYDLDLGASNPSNKLSTGYVRDVPVGSHWFFAMDGGLFYTKDLVIVDNVTNQELRPNVQYRAMQANSDLTKEAIMTSGMEVASIITILDDATTDITVTRRVVGGKFAISPMDVAKTITQDDLDKLGSSAWGQVVGTPNQYPFQPHVHYLDQVTGTNSLIDVLEMISSAIGKGDTAAFNMVYQYIDRKANALKATIDQRHQAVMNLLQSATDRTSPQVGLIIALDTNQNPKDIYQFGTWLQINGLLRGVGSDSDLGQTKQLGQGGDYNVRGVYYWKLISLN